MVKLRPEQYAIAQPLFSELVAFNFSLDAALAGTGRGEIWVDDPFHPHVGFAVTTEGHYLGGDAGYKKSYAKLKKIIPHFAYLVFDPHSWEDVLGQIWDNPLARKHLRCNYLFQQPRLPDWRSRLPAQFQLAPVDRKLLRKTSLKNYNEISRRMEDWFSVDYFMTRGFGFCLLHGATIVSRCIADCVVGERCEIGIGTDPLYRRQGLASLLVAATVEHCLARGYSQIGWHCLDSNTGSKGVAEKAGFTKVREYFAYSSVLPSENASDLTTTEYEDWARHLEGGWEINPWHAFNAAGAWALAGNAERALANLGRLSGSRWDGRAEWIEESWMFASLRHRPEFKLLIEGMREET